MCKNTDLKFMNYVNSSLYKQIFAQNICIKADVSKYLHECTRAYSNLYV